MCVLHRSANGERGTGKRERHEIINYAYQEILNPHLQQIPLLAESSGSLRTIPKAFSHGKTPIFTPYVSFPFGPFSALGYFITIA